MESEKLVNLVENIYYDVPLYDNNVSEEFEPLEEIFGLKRLGQNIQHKRQQTLTIQDYRKNLDSFKKFNNFYGWVLSEYPNWDRKRTSAVHVNVLFKWYWNNLGQGKMTNEDLLAFQRNLVKIGISETTKTIRLNQIENTLRRLSDNLEKDFKEQTTKGGGPEDDPFGGASVI